MPTSTGPQYQFLGTEALDRQIELLKYYPEIWDKHFFPALQQAAELVKNGIRPNLPHHTGKLERALGSKITHRTGKNPFSSLLGSSAAIDTQAEIGFGKRYGKPSARYAAAVNQGTVSHEVVGKPPRPGTTKKDNLLHFSSRGRFTAIGSVRVQGFSGRHFMEAGLEETKPGIDALMETAAGQVVQELAKP